MTCNYADICWEPITTLLCPCIGAEKTPTGHCQGTFTRETCQKMYATGYRDVQKVFTFKLMTNIVVPCRFEHPVHTLAFDYAGKFPVSPNGNKWILTAVCSYSNFLQAIPVLFLINMLPQLPGPCMTMYSWNVDSLLFFEVTKVVNGHMHFLKK